VTPTFFINITSEGLSESEIPEVSFWYIAALADSPTLPSISGEIYGDDIGMIQ